MAKNIFQKLADAMRSTSKKPIFSGATYEVKSGDTLSAIAGRVYNDSSRWREIYNANRDQINARLLAVFPQGFALDATHRPHITLLQCFVRTADLGKIHAAAGKVFAGTDVLGLRMEPREVLAFPGVLEVEIRRAPDDPSVPYDWKLKEG